MKLQEILKEVKKAIQISKPDYNIVIKRLHLYYDMKLVTFGINEERNLIVQFPVFIQPYIQEQLILYQNEMVPVPIIDQNNQAHSCTHLQVDRPYIALNSETYISLRHQGLSVAILVMNFTVKNFLLLKINQNSCESVVYLDPGSEIIKEKCKFAYYFNKTDIKPPVLDGGNEIILANWPNNKHTECNINDDIPVKIPSFPYVLVNRSVLCNCEIEAENHFLLESLAACHDTKSKLVMYLTVNKAFINYLNNLTKSLKFPLLLNWTIHEQTIPISLQSFNFDPDLLKSSKTLKDFVHQFQHKKEIFVLQKGIIIMV